MGHRCDWKAAAPKGLHSPSLALNMAMTSFSLQNMNGCNVCHFQATMVERYRGLSCGLSPHSPSEWRPLSRWQRERQFFFFGGGYSYWWLKMPASLSHCLEASHLILMWARNDVSKKWTSVLFGPLFILIRVVVAADAPHPLHCLWIHSLLPRGCQAPSPASGQLPGGLW